MKLKNEYSQALGFGMTYSDKSTMGWMDNRNNVRCRVWVDTGLDEAMVRRKLDEAGLEYLAVKCRNYVGSYLGMTYTQHYVRVYIQE
jgi:hypothetical protein